MGRVSDAYGRDADGRFFILESKVGYQGKKTLRQATADCNLLKGGTVRVDYVEWHFFLRDTTKPRLLKNLNTRIGATTAVLETLENCGIRYFVHVS